MAAGEVSVGESAMFAPLRRVIACRLGQTEIQDLYAPVVGDFDVGRLQVAMDDPELVRGGKGLGDLARDRQRIRRPQRTVCRRGCSLRAAMSSASVAPLTSSMTMARVLPDSSMP